MELSIPAMVRETASSDTACMAEHDSDNKATVRRL